MKTIIQKRSMDVNAKTCGQPCSGGEDMVNFLLMEYIAEVPGRELLFIRQTDVVSGKASARWTLER